MITKRKKKRSKHETLKCTKWYLVVNDRNDKREPREEEDGTEKKRKDPERGCEGIGGRVNLGK